MSNQRQPFCHQVEWSVPRHYGAAALHVTCNQHQDPLRRFAISRPQGMTPQETRT